MESRQDAKEATATGSSLHGGNNGAASAEATPPPPAPPSLTPKPVPKYCETYPTTFVQADTSSFKQVVQMLTGSAQTAAAAAPPAVIPPSAKCPPSLLQAVKATAPKKPAFKLYERRNSMKNLKLISPLVPAFFGANSYSPGGAVAAFSPRRQPEILSPSILDFPSLVLSPVTPLIPDPFNRPLHPSSEAAKWVEERAIADKGFYLHPSPRATTPRGSEIPKLLPLFPTTSPRASSAPSSMFPSPP